MLYSGLSLISPLLALTRTSTCSITTYLLLFIFSSAHQLIRAHSNRFSTTHPSRPNRFSLSFSTPAVAPLLFPPHHHTTAHYHPTHHPKPTTTHPPPNEIRLHLSSEQATHKTQKSTSPPSTQFLFFNFLYNTKEACSFILSQLVFSTQSPHDWGNFSSTLGPSNPYYYPSHRPIVTTLPPCDLPAESTAQSPRGKQNLLAQDFAQIRPHHQHHHRSSPKK